MTPKQVVETGRDGTVGVPISKRDWTVKFNGMFFHDGTGW